ncbi:TRAP transporter substrate-binding protein [Terrihabitans rhizophilus]|uniref:TRAP transporter substrate-binding protein n=1 Tax=Terrihabitans rhizophilus TaxID=3092662 RepID=A0ABU4RNM0_9HYPH|nr:TRAP transporter substrate-binding protein [Terrihabitans sp. PJ23]MDX6806201.1 TRAP transporter substrate-binding protein [Terrihabitans sp. PJ23]
MISRRTLIGAAFALAAATTAGHAQVTLRSADIHPDGYPTVEAVKYFGQLVEERTKGALKAQVFSSAQLGQEKDTIEQTRFGVIDLNRVNMGAFNNLIPETTVPGLPFVFKSIAHMRHVMDGPIGDEILRAFEPHGLVGLAFYDSGARSFYNSKKPINSPADMKGMKIRVQQADLFIAMVNALGANATPMPAGEVYGGIQTGVVDGAENNWPSYDSFRHAEVAKFYSLTEHSMSPEVFVMSKLKFDRLTPEQQGIVRAAAKESVAKMRELWDAREKASEAKVRAAGAQVNTVDKQPFIDAVQPLYAKYAKDAKLKDLVARIQATN